MKKIKNIAFGLSLPLFALLAACGSQPSAITLPDGEIAYRIDCGQASGGMNFCFEQAGKSCGEHGYTIVRPDGTTVSSSAVAQGERATRVRENLADRNSILVTCGEG